MPRERAGEGPGAGDVTAAAGVELPAAAGHEWGGDFGLGNEEGDSGGQSGFHNVIYFSWQTISRFSLASLDPSHL